MECYKSTANNLFTIFSTTDCFLFDFAMSKMVSSYCNTQVKQSEMMQIRVGYLIQQLCIHISVYTNRFIYIPVYVLFRIEDNYKMSKNSILCLHYTGYD